MTTRISPAELQHLRNHLAVDEVIEFLLQLPSERNQGLFRFLCPLCSQYNTAVNPTTNLGRCFTCLRNFNTIDVVMIARHCSFPAAVRALQHYQHRKATQQQAIATLISRFPTAR